MGLVLFNDEFVRTNALSEHAPVFTIVGVYIFIAGLSGFTPLVVVQIGAAFFGFGLFGLGVSWWSKTADNVRMCFLNNAME